MRPDEVVHQERGRGQLRERVDRQKRERSADEIQSHHAASRCGRSAICVSPRRLRPAPAALPPRAQRVGLVALVARPDGDIGHPLGASLLPDEPHGDGKEAGRLLGSQEAHALTGRGRPHLEQPTVPPSMWCPLQRHNGRCRSACCSPGSCPGTISCRHRKDSACWSGGGMRPCRCSRRCAPPGAARAPGRSGRPHGSCAAVQPPCAVASLRAAEPLAGRPVQGPVAPQRGAELPVGRVHECALRISRPLGGSPDDPSVSEPESPDLALARCAEPRWRPQEGRRSRARGPASITLAVRRRMGRVSRDGRRDTLYSHRRHEIASAE